MMDVLTIAFRNRGWHVDGAANADDALALFRRATPDVILTDKNLPGMSGVELIRQLRAADELVGIVLMTAYGTVESARDTLNLGVDEYVEKPFASLFGVVESADALRRRVVERRRVASLKPAGGPLTIVVAATGARRDRLAAHLQAANDRVVWVDQDGLKPQARSERADLVIIDGPSFPEEITCLAAEIRTRARSSACLVLGEALSLSDVKRLIQLEVKALIEVPLDSPRFATMFAGAVERIRKSKAR